MSLIIAFIGAIVATFSINVIAVSVLLKRITSDCVYEPNLSSKILGYTRLIHPTIYYGDNSYPLEFVNTLLVLILNIPKYTHDLFESCKYGNNTAFRIATKHIKCGIFSLIVAISLYCNNVDGHIAYIKRQVAEQMYVHVKSISLGLLNNCYRGGKPYRQWVFPNKKSTGIIIGYHDDSLVYLLDE